MGRVTNEGLVPILTVVDDQQLLLARMALDRDGVPFFIRGEHYGALFPGIQVPWKNERTIMVPAACVEQASAVLIDALEYHEPCTIGRDWRTWIRVALEVTVLGWAVPAKDDPSREASPSEAADSMDAPSSGDESKRAS